MVVDMAVVMEEAAAAAGEAEVCMPEWAVDTEVMVDMEEEEEVDIVDTAEVDTEKVEEEEEAVPYTFLITTLTLYPTLSR
jgi:hypothetical protein